MKRKHRPVHAPLFAAILICMGALFFAGCKKPEDSPQAPTPTAAPADPATTGTAAVSTPLDGKALVAERCVKCHDTKRIMAAGHDRAGWEKTVARMLQKPNGNVLNAEEKEAAIAYLVTLPKPAE
jgi:cytochrome c5